MDCEGAGGEAEGRSVGRPQKPDREITAACPEKVGGGGCGAATLVFSSSDNTRELENIFCGTPKTVFFADLTPQNRYTFDSLTSDGYCWVGCCHVLV